MRISIDPGVSGTGYAIWTDDGVLKEWGNIYPDAADQTFDTRARSITKKLRVIALRCKISDCYIELPALHSSEGGAVTARSGALVKLAFMVGMVYSMFQKSHLIPVADWKGSLPKEVVASRVRKQFPGKAIVNHSVDAVGIGLYVTGRF